MKSFLLGLAIGILLLFFWINLGLGSRTGQPISFNHKKHLEQGLECDSCHRYFKTQTFSGMPDIAICLECHKEPVTKNPEEEKIRQFEKKERANPLETRSTGSPIMFSSPIGDMWSWGKWSARPVTEISRQSEKPPSRPWVKMTMNWCMDCHAKKKVTNDCLACHV